MIKQYELQDQHGNKIYNHTSSDVVFDLDTGHSVKQDIDTILSALGLSDKEAGDKELKIDANSISGKTINDLVLKETYSAAIAGISEEIANKAPLASPVFTGNPTAPDVEAGDSTTKIANTKFVNTAITAALESYAHTHSADNITAGTFEDTDVKAKNGADYAASRIRNISFLGESEELPSTLENGSILAVYEG